MDNNRKWQVIDSQYLAKEPWFTVRKERILLPTGNIIPEYYIYEYPDWVNVIAITKDNKFVMVRQYRHGIGETYMELPAGVCEKGEAPVVSAQRELLEETGYGNGEWQLLTETSANPSTHTNITHCYLAIGVEKVSEQHLEPSEDLSVHLLSVDEIRELLLNDQIKQSMHAVPLWKYMALNKLI
ncbi:MAG: NUDIX hydrolase [Prevotella sp.]|nr:NUDIX hydrolase [Prevotella sp.]